ncbi:MULTISPECIES: DUF302 domain-containing protein [unclassified Neisseria]|uniref:DUF302 domain-containing protein n=1 Tax=unclassified Neisseria TaxID=2623750 RepID=UPI0026654EFE|nr:MULTISPECIES: DUF302 domain-containing protein [unclassified Neisseria]MDO1510312.1 DUF302 domain-containing protein [Neisseria sp. MVDL19-042950]MDO1516481.1 DUF302 domain-containing protein [Neisseria sp. MVDL18-041461]MDO1563726.1 DUF302 domain-containing protein [Neisseria sp. MVDL20-010259]
MHTPNADKHADSSVPATHSVASRYTFNETVSRLENTIKAKGMVVFTVIDHQAAAQKYGLTMQPAKVIVFGQPKIGTPLMLKDPEFALQLPMRVLVTETNGEVKAVFTDVRTLIRDSRIEYRDVENTLANAEKLIRKTVSE